jgi:hypothetical protein
LLLRHERIKGFFRSRHRCHDNKFIIAMSTVMSKTIISRHNRSIEVLLLRRDPADRT